MVVNKEIYPSFLLTTSVPRAMSTVLILVMHMSASGRTWHHLEPIIIRHSLAISAKRGKARYNVGSRVPIAPFPIGLWDSPYSYPSLSAALSQNDTTCRHRRGSRCSCEPMVMSNLRLEAASSRSYDYFIYLLRSAVRRVWFFIRGIRGILWREHQDQERTPLRSIIFVARVIPCFVGVYIRFQSLSYTSSSKKSDAISSS